MSDLILNSLSCDSMLIEILIWCKFEVLYTVCLTSLDIFLFRSPDLGTQNKFHLVSEDAHLKKFNNTTHIIIIIQG